MLELDEFARYGRQMIVPEIGLLGQEKIKSSKILVVGAGGLGCPAIAYLAGAGVGTLGIVDPDTVEVSNLHRQIVHKTPGIPKCESAKEFASQLNDNVHILTWKTALTSLNAIEICQGFDVVIDCTDTPMSRYLINDTCVVLNIPLVSASALKTEGQLALYNYKNGPCYRCLFPRPPPAGAVTACGDGGIIGSVVGTMGVLQATEAIKIVVGAGEYVPCLMLYSAMSFPPWRCVKIRSKQKNCICCGENPQITIDNLATFDYSEFCGGQSSTELVSSQDRVTAKAISEHAGPIIDVRPAVQFGICSLDNSINIPIDRLKKFESLADVNVSSNDNILVVCRYGNDSQLAVNHLKSLGAENVHDVIGGLAAFSRQEQPSFPTY